ncbi:type VI secretion system transmembrane protein TssO [Chryseobacterium rhizoplanae]|uniref:type VI secretion system TssO n=1 Tax=Chryseobacterium rhizoplanae TaxID=1609531 RepID=UPI001CE38F63|nr:type VI secretion system TssO [Chryseobacterium rhizoplanae]UCA61770.1 type VI secretion system transmembrane protein TssO [Chryseobacterium rhizoplanae]
MEVLNKKERWRAFLFFILFFLIAVFTLVSGLFFNTYFPFKENMLLKAENNTLKREMGIQDRFSFQLEKVKSAVDSIGVPGKNDFFNENMALSLLSDMYREIPKDDIKNEIMYNNTIIAYKDLVDRKKEMKRLSSTGKAVDSLLTINKIIKQEYDKVKTDLDVCRQLYKSQ